MNKNIIKTIFLSFILFISIIFINIDGVKADNHSIKGSTNGYAKCYYTWYQNTIETGGQITDPNSIALDGYSYGHYCRPYKFGFVVYEDTKGAIQVKYELGCGSSKGDGHFNQKTDGTCSVANSVTLKAAIVANSVSGSQNNRTYNCPNSIYYTPSGTDLSNSKNIFFSNSDGAGTASSNGSIVNNNEKPSSLQVHDYELNGCDQEPQTAREQAESEKEIDDIDSEKVKNWGKNATIESPDAGSTSCDLIPRSIVQFLNNLFLIIQIIGIILLIILSAVEFIKALTGADEDGLKGAIKNTFRRIIMVILLLLIPMIVIWILNIINDNRYEKENGNYVIGENGNPLCK